MVVNLLSGGLAGATALFVSYPFDVARTRYVLSHYHVGCVLNLVTVLICFKKYVIFAGWQWMSALTAL